MKVKRFLLHITIIVVLLLILVLSPCVGMTFINPFTLTNNSFEKSIFLFIRIPRLIVALIAGGGLALCGMVFQAMLRNPLADPYTLGVSSGASLGAAITILFGWDRSFFILTPTMTGAFIGAIAAIFLVYTVSSLQRFVSQSTILLAGISVTYLFASMLMLIQYFSSMKHSFHIVRWLMGGLEVYGYSQVISILPFLFIGIIVISFNLPRLNLLMTGFELAATRGINVRKTELSLYFAASFIVAAIVTLCGPIGFVGMMVPHFCRKFFFNDHRILGPAVFVFGGVFLVICDTIARTIIAPSEIPVGILTALFGGPFFLWLLFQKKQFVI